MQNSYSEAIDLWKQLSNYWSLQKNRKSINLIWQAAIESVNELAAEELNKTIYSIEEMSPTKTVPWERIAIEQDLLLDEDILSIPIMQDGVNKYVNAYTEGVDYSINGHILHWEALPAGTYLYAPTVVKENELMDIYFNNGFLDLDFTGFDVYQKKHILRLVWNILKIGPSTANIEAVINALSGMPFMRYQGVPNIGTTVSYNNYVMPVSTYNDTVKLFAYTSKRTMSITVASNKTSAADIDTGDLLLINDEYYLIIDNISDVKEMLESIDDGYYEDITVFRLPGWSPSIYLNAAVLDTETNNIYYYKNGELSDLPVGDRDDMVFGHRYVLEQYARAISSNNAIDKISGIPDSKTSYSELYVRTGEDSEQILTQDREEILVGETISNTAVPAFAPIQKLYTINTWKDNVNADIDLKLRNDLINNSYNEEINASYFLSGNDDGHLEVYRNDYLDRLAEGDYIEISHNSKAAQIATSIEYVDDVWKIKVGSAYNYFYGQNIYIIQEYDPDDPSIGRRVHRGGRYCITDGKYENNGYELTVNGDLSELYDNFDDVDTQVIILKNIKDINKVNSRADKNIYIEGRKDADLDSLPIIQKTKLGNYGDSTVHNVSSVSGTVISFDSRIEDQAYNYLIIKDALNPSSIYRVEGYSIEYEEFHTSDVGEFTVNDGHGGTEQMMVIKSWDITVDRELDYDYAPATTKAILIKTLPYHNGFCIKIEEAINADDIAEILDYIVGLHPFYYDNITKILTLLLPSGYKYEWQPGSCITYEYLVVLNSFGNPVIMVDSEGEEIMVRKNL